MLEHSTHAAGGAFRPKGQRLVVAIAKGVHLFVDDVGPFTDAAREQLGVLDDRQTDLAVAVRLQQLGESALEVTPDRSLGRQDVVHATNGLQGLAQR